MDAVKEGKDFSFPAEEELILQLWNDLDAFQEQLKRTEGKPEYVFYDGPPFATGLPHYGHILAGTLKDIVTRYASMDGHHVVRRFGWDCHGLPVEHEIDKMLQIKSRQEVLDMGIGVYNEECRKIVMRYSQQWEKTVHRLGRWISFTDGYKTLDPSFMESVWWVFQRLHQKGLVYKGVKVMPFSTGLTTSLSNFEAALNYKDVVDPAVMVSFPLLEDADGAALVAWTTTPWTLPSNLALCVNPLFTYVKVKDPEKGKVYVVAESRLAFLPGAVPKAKKAKKGKEEGAPKAGFQVLSTMLGKELVGRRYQPLFPFFADHVGAFRVVADAYVTDDSGTGVVHQAPAFGEDDFRVCMAAGVIRVGEDVPCPVDLNGRFEEPVSDFLGSYVKDADKDIIAAIKGMGRLVDHASLTHSYPFCWRSHTPLIYRTVPSWFVRVEAIKERLLACNAQTHWVPAYVKEKRFQNWLENAHDWAISRSRFWGTPIPIWSSEDGSEIVVVGSVQQLEELTGEKVTDLHRHFIDHLTVPSPTGGPPLKRVDDVFDCWFESGSMPYAQAHYPFENKERFEATFPADFVAEGLDQTRGWFYTLMVLSTALFDKPAFKNLVCNGLVLAEDGKKMSKSLKNYPDPNDVINKYGADALRLYLINSPVVRAETLRFKEEAVFAVVKDVFLPWYNAYRFLVQNVLRWEAESSTVFNPAALDLAGADNVLDCWIAAAGRKLTSFVRVEMAAYRLYTVVPFLVRFIDSLTNIYVRYNRKRLKGGKGPKDCSMALASLFTVLLDVAKVMAPFTPFLTEAMYQNLRRCLPPGAPESVHFCDVPPAVPELAGDERIQLSVERMQRIIELGRTIRNRSEKPVRLPLQRLVVVHPDPDFLHDIQGPLREYVVDELNIRELEACGDQLQYCTLRAEPEWGLLGKKLGKSLAAVGKAVKALSAEQVLRYEAEGRLEVAGQLLEAGELKVLRDFKVPDGLTTAEVDAAGDGEVLAVLDLRVDASLQLAGLAREVVSRYQKLRKTAGLSVTDVVAAYYGPADSSTAVEDGGSSAMLDAVLAAHSEYLKEALGVALLPVWQMPAGAVLLASEQQSVGGGEGPAAAFTAVLTRPSGGAADAAATQLASSSL